MPPPSPPPPGAPAPRLLPRRALRLIRQHLGPSYWRDRARLTWLNVHLDLVQSDWFDRWDTAARWAAWYARHPELSRPTTTMPSETPGETPGETRWETTLPPRLRRIRARTTLLDRDLAHFAEVARLPPEEQSARLRAYRAQAHGWRSEASRLRTRVHW